jgi:uncharacterized protein YegP (UPF0339 family)
MIIGKMIIIEIFKDCEKQFRFRIKARNGKVIAQSEGYKAKRNAHKAIGVIIRAASIKVKDLTK